MMMKLSLEIISFVGVVTTASAMSCFCQNPSPNLSNSLYTSNYVAKVHVTTLIENPNPILLDDDLIASSISTYYRAKVKGVFKKKHRNDIIYDEDIVVEAGGCQSTPDEETTYVLFSSYLGQADVPGYGNSTIMSMPTYCEIEHKWHELPAERITQLRRHRKMGETPCFEGDCDWQATVSTPTCPDGSLPNVTVSACKYNQKSNQCQQDMDAGDCPPPPINATVIDFGNATLPLDNATSP